MHIIFKSSEKAILQAVALPDGTSLVEKHDTKKTKCGFGAIVAKWTIVNGQWHLCWW